MHQLWGFLVLWIGLFLQFGRGYLLLHEVGPFDGGAAFGLVGVAASREQFGDVVEEVIVPDAALLGLHPAVDEISVVFLGDFLILFLEDTIVALEEVLFDEYLLEFLPNRLQFVPIIFVFSDQLFHFFLVDAVILIGLQSQHGVPELAVFALKFADCHFEAFDFHGFGLIGRFSLVSLGVCEEDLSVSEGGDFGLVVLIAVVPGGVGD
jgi:hypothetical protein